MCGLEGKIVLVTGSSSGIGAGAAMHFSAMKCRLSLVARSIDNLIMVAEAYRTAGAADVLVLSKDLSIAEECVSAVEDTVTHFKGLDCVVNNAGILLKGDIFACTVQHFEMSMNVNAKSAFLITKAAIPHLANSDVKSIVNVSSIAGLRAYPGSITYKISKSAMDQLTRCSALDVAKLGIRINSVNPGVIEDTGMTMAGQTSGMSEEAVREYMKHCVKTHPLGRPGRIEEVAKVITFLASQNSSFVTGQTLAVDGGRSVMCPY